MRCSRATARRRCPSCRRSTAASSAGSATTPCARSSACRTCRPTTSGHADAVLLARGSGRGVRPLPPAVLPDRERVPAARRRRRDARTAVRRRAVERLDRAVDEIGRPLPYLPALPPARRAHRAARACAATSSSARMGDGGRRREGAHPRRRHLPGGARAALRPRRTGRSVLGVPRAAAREPVAVHVLPAASRGDDRRLVARADGAAARRPRDQPPDRRDPPPRPRRASTTSGSRPSSSSIRRSAPST